MTGASKILTVSYGTFSCTLEGFDDPFNTMKAIAEYFRDLAADDRYFGAEPPTPDAAMLHKIAEREIQRRVEAKIQENGVVLRAAEGLGAGVNASLSIPAVGMGTAAAAAPSVAVTAPVLDAPRSDAGMNQPTESVAEKLSRLRADAAQAAPVADVAETMPLAAPAALAPAPAPALASDAETDALLSGLMADLSAPGDDVAVDAPADVPVTQPVAFDAVATRFADDTPVSDDLTDVIDFPAPERHIPADFAAEDADPAAEMDMAATTDADTFDLSAFVAQIDDAAPVVTDAEMPAETSVAPQDDTFDADLAAAIDMPTAEDDEDDFAADMPSIFGGTDRDDPAEAVAEPVSAEAEADIAPEQVTAAAPEIAAAIVAAPLADTQTDAPQDIRPEAAEKLQRARARVIRIRRAEAAAAAAVPAPAVAVDLPAAPLTAPVLSPEAEADLEAELAALRAEMAPAQGDAVPQMDLTPEPAPHHADAAPARRAFTEVAADEAVSRLMAQADEVMEGPESKRRLSAIAHLKAAVAATVAERKAAGDVPATEPSRLSRYRDDLAAVVRAKLGVGPAVDGASAADRPAPLVLVSEQRIDRAARRDSVSAAAPMLISVANTRPEADLTAPDTDLSVFPDAFDDSALAAAVAPEQDAVVRPRRIAAPALAEDTTEAEDDTIDAALVDVRGFTEFADRLGARTLPELIEASAAYLSVVQKRDAFSRPQLMANVQAALPEDLPREDGLRSFGVLLRSGRLTKLRRGQFVLSQQSNYLNEGKRIAG